RKRPEEQHCFSFRARHQTNHNAYQANREGTCAPRRTRTEHLSASSATQLRDASPGERRRSAHHPGNARPRRYLDDASLYARRPTAIESCASAISSESVAGVIRDPRPWIPKQFAFDPVSSIEYPASAALRRSWL